MVVIVRQKIQSIFVDVTMGTQELTAKLNIVYVHHCHAKMEESVRQLDLQVILVHVMLDTPG
jgi:hypothetical protein